MAWLDTAKRLFLRFYWALVAGLLAVIYYPLLRDDPVIYRDDVALLTPIIRAPSARWFFWYMFSSTNPDVQPIRDLSFAIDVLIARFVGIRTLPAHSVLIWIGCCALSVSLARRWVRDELTAKAWGLLFALHPLYVMTVGWIAARKHLLALFFLLLALHALARLREAETRPAIRRAAVSLFLAYAASLLSQPIYLVFPAWLLVLAFADTGTRAWIRRHRALATAIFAGIGSLSAVLFVVNFLHYHAYYLAYEQKSGKVTSLDLSNVTPAGDALLALGRYFFQIVAPFKYAVLYSQASIENIVGLVLLPLFAYLCVSVLGGRRTLLGISFFVLALTIVLTKIRTFFISDTYLPGASLGIWALLLALWCEPLAAKATAVRRRIGSLLLPPLAFFLGVQAALAARTWQSDERMWERSYRLEPNCMNSMSYAFILFAKRRIPEALEVSDFHYRNQCVGEISRPLYYVSAFYHEGISLAEKIAIVGAETDPHPTRLAILAALYMKNGQPEEARRTLDTLMAKDSRFWTSLHHVETDPVQDAVRSYCQRVPSFAYCWLATVKNPN